MKDETQPQTSSNFSIDLQFLEELVNKWMQREHGSDDIDLLESKGGDQQLLQQLKTDPSTGINSSTIEERELYFGSNRKEKIPPKGFFQLIWEALDDLILQILLVAGIGSIIIQVVTEEEKATAWIEGFAIVMAVVIVVVVTAWNDLKKEQEFQKLNDEAEEGKKVSAIRDGKEIDDLKIGDIVVGDIILLKSGNEIPGDGIIIQGFSVQMDESSMTGETKPMKKEPLQQCLRKKDDLLKEGIDKISHHAIPSVVIMAGTKVLSGSGKMVVINVGPNSSIGKIKAILVSEDEMTPLQMKLEKIARDIGIFGLIAAIIIFVVLIIRLLIEGSQDDWDEGTGFYIKEALHYFIIAITILVVAIPEGLPLAVTLSLAVSVGKMMEDKNLVRQLQACETMGGANIICSDKTGTLTRNVMFLTHLWNGKIRQVFNPETDTPHKYSDFIKEQEAAELFQNTVCLNSVEDPRKQDGNPTEMAILKYFNQCGVNVVEYRSKFEKVYEASFSSDRKRMSTLIKMDDGRHFVFMKGASEYMIDVSDKFLDFDTGKVMQINYEIKKDMNDAVLTMATQALRTIGLCYKEVDINNINVEDQDDRGIQAFEKDGFTLVGICGIKDIIRGEVPKSIQKCHTAGVQVKMVTGDNKITAKAIAKEIGIIDEKNEATAIVMEGPEFLRKVGGIICENCREKEVCDCVKNEKELKLPENKGKQVRKDTIKNQEEFDKIWQDLLVLARSRPEDKYALVIGLKERHNVVAVTGDGTNDAPALSKADVGFAMNIAGTEVAKQAADILIMDDNFASIVQAVKWGRNIYDSIRKFLQFQLTVNIVAVLSTFIAAMILKEAVLSAVQMLWINLIMDTLGALALATEPPTEALLLRKPHGRKDYIVSPLMMKHIIGQAIFQIIIMMIFVFAGEHFLFDIIGQRQIQPGHKYLIVHGRTVNGYDRDDHDNQYSVHYTYNFNVFVMLQVFNFINCRIIDDRLNPFAGIFHSYYFVVIIPTIFVLQIIFLTFCGPAIRVVQWGLDPISWLFCMAFGLAGMVWDLILKFIPLERILPGGGHSEITKEQLDRTSTMNLRKKHDSNFYRHQSGIQKGSSIIEDRSMKH